MCNEKKEEEEEERNNAEIFQGTYRPTVVYYKRNI
jgi:hypothetical protein